MCERDVRAASIVDRTRYGVELLRRSEQRLDALEIRACLLCASALHQLHHLGCTGFELVERCVQLAGGILVAELRELVESGVRAALGIQDRDTLVPAAGNEVPALVAVELRKACL